MCNSHTAGATFRARPRGWQDIRNLRGNGRVASTLTTATARGSHRLVVIRRRVVAWQEARRRRGIVDMSGGMDARVAMWELRQGEMKCASGMKGRGRTRYRRQGCTYRIEWFDRGREGRVRGGQRGEVLCLRWQRFRRR